MADSNAIRAAAARLETALAEADTVCRALYETTGEPAAWVDLFQNEIRRLSEAAEQMLCEVNRA